MADFSEISVFRFFIDLSKLHAPSDRNFARAAASATASCLFLLSRVSDHVRKRALAPPPSKKLAPLGPSVHMSSFLRRLRICSRFVPYLLSNS